MPNARPCRTRRSSRSADLLRDLVVLDEELLELVDDEQDAGQGVAALVGLAVAVEVLDAEVAERVAAVLQLDVEPLQHAQAELALALDGDHPGVGQLHARRRP